MRTVTKFEVSNVNELSIDYNGSNYLVIFGHHINGGFFAIPNWGVSGEMSDASDKFYNSESIGRALEDARAGKAIAEVIACWRTTSKEDFEK